MRIAIDLNGVLRDTFGKFTQLYQKHMIDEYQDQFTNETYKLDQSGDTEIETITEFKYETNLPINTYNLQNHFKFQNEEEFYSFMYEEFPMQIFGHAGSTELSTLNDLNEIYLEYRDKNDFYIISNEIGKSKPASLFFLSKFGCLIERIFFYSNSTINDMWNEINVLLTSNPELLLNHPEDVIVVKYETEYNKNISSNYTIKKIKDFSQLLKQLNHD
jgi:hypothetical protein